MRYRLREVASACAGELAAPVSRVVTGVSVDTRTMKSGDLFFCLRGARYDGEDFASEAARRGASAVVTAKRGRRVPHVLVPDTLRALGALSSWHRAGFTGTVVAVTGSVGKTTTKQMLGMALGEGAFVSPASFNNSVGVPLSLLRAPVSADYVVLEMGTSASGELAALSRTASPDVALITAVGRAHLEFFSTMGELAREKAGVAAGMKPGATVLVPSEAFYLLREPLAGARVVTFGFGPESDYTGENLRLDAAGARFTLRDVAVALPFPHEGLAHDALAALSLAAEVGVPLEKAAEALAGFTPSDGRFEVSFERGVTVVNDAYNANPESVSSLLAALARMGGRVVLVLGDMLELGARSREFHREVGRGVASLDDVVLLCVGGYAEDLAVGAREAGVSKVHVFDSVERATEFLAANLRGGDTLAVKASHLMALHKMLEALRAREVV